MTEFKETKRGKIDYILLAAVLALVVIGLVFVYSASFYTAEKNTGNKYFYLIKQSFGCFVGLIVLFLARLLPQKLLKRAALPLAILSAVLLGLVLIPGVGVENYGARRWIGVGSMTFQPSEIAKFALVLFTAWYVSKEKVDIKKFKSLLPIIAVGGVYCLLIIAEPNMSITVCVGAVMLILLFVSGARIKHFVFIVAPVLAAVPLLIFAEPYRIKRLLAFLDPWASPKDEGYQLIQSLYALGSGGWFGIGLFNSRQKYSFLPFAESDFVFSVIGEETGVLGCLAVVALFVVVIMQGTKIAVNSSDLFDTVLAGGITAVIGVQAAINFAVVTGLIPPTGLPLPFISFGGTSLVVFLAAVGLLQGIYRRNAERRLTEKSVLPYIKM